MRIAYAKLGRSIPLNIEDASAVGGDAEVIRLLDKLVSEGHEVHVVSRTVRGSRRTDGSVVDHWASGGAFAGLGVINPSGAKPTDEAVIRYRDDLTRRVASLPEFDAWIIWIGIHGTSSWFIPSIDRPGDTVTPQVQQINYVLPVAWALNHHNPSNVMWLCPDPRNLFKDRTIYNIGDATQPILGQYKTSRVTKSWVAPEDRMVERNLQYVYSAVEMLAIPEPDVLGWHDIMTRPIPDDLFGIMVNEGRPSGTHARSRLVKDWIIKQDIDFEIFGEWSLDGQAQLKRKIMRVPYGMVNDTLQRWRSTITFPASSTGWATAKPWECFAAGVVCFAHPLYDDQQNIFGKDMPERLRDFLRVKTPAELKERVEKLADNHLWQLMVRDQYEYLVRAYKSREGGYHMIRERLGQ